MTKFDDDEMDKDSTAAAAAAAASAAAGSNTGRVLRNIAIDKGIEVVTLFLSETVKAHSKDPVMQAARVPEDLTAKEISDEMTINFQFMINTFIISLLRTVQKTNELIAATGLLTSEGIPWESENFEPEEIFAEADRLIREAEAKAEGRT